MTITQADHDRLQRRGIRLEWATTGWNLMEVFVTIGLGVAAGSLALVAFGLSSMIEVFASSVVIWHLRAGRDPAPHLTRLAFKLIAVAFFALAAFLFVTSVRSLVLGLHPGESPLGIAYLALTAAVMLSNWLLAKGVCGDRKKTFLPPCSSANSPNLRPCRVVFGWVRTR